MSRITAAIKGVAGYVPDYVLTNKELESYVDTNDEWIVTRTGIKERRILKEEGSGTSYLMIKAIKALLEKTNTNPEEIDLVISCTTTPDLVFPATGNIVSAKCGIKNAFSYDLQAACSGFLYGLATGAAFIASGTYKKVIVVGADKMSSIVDYQDRATCIIFGDGGGAVLLEPSEDGFGVIDQVLRADGTGEAYLHMKAGGSRNPASHETVDRREHFVFQEGSTVFKHAVTSMADVAEEILKRNNLKGDDIAYLVAHQANKRIIDATANRCGLTGEKVLMNIEKYGNTTNGTIPLVLWDFESKFKKGDNLLLTAFGGGFTWGAILLKWAY